MNEELFPNRVPNETVIKMRNREDCMINEAKFWTDDDIQRLEILYQLGTGITEMAFIFQRSEHAIAQQLHILGISRSPIKRKPYTKKQKYLCTTDTFDPTLCPLRENCPHLKEVQ